jgi:hypothetical protein
MKTSEEESLADPNGGSEPDVGATLVRDKTNIAVGTPTNTLCHWYDSSTLGRHRNDPEMSTVDVPREFAHAL